MKKKAVKIKTRTWDAAEHLTTEEDMAVYLEAALEDGDPALIAAALGDIARAKDMGKKIYKFAKQYNVQ
jgi:probable addiction module antidote protein